MSQSRPRFIAAILYRRISRLTTGDAALAKRSRQERAPNEDVANRSALKALVQQRLC
jgi:hypothetical protein